MSRADLEMLDRVLAPANDPELSPTERRAFTDMRLGLRSGDIENLSTKQRAWLVEVDVRLAPIDVSRVPPLSGKVPTMPVLAAPLPKKPPGRAS